MEDVFALSSWVKIWQWNFDGKKTKKEKKKKKLVE